MKEDSLAIETESKKDWKARVLADLKGKPFESIQCEVEPGLILDPFYTLEEVEHYPPIEWSTDWKIVETFIVSPGDNQEEINATIINSLAGGCQVIQLNIDPKVRFDPATLLKDVLLELITTRVLISAKHQELLIKYVSQYATDQNVAIAPSNLEMIDITHVKMSDMSNVDVYTDQLGKILNSLSEKTKGNSWEWSDFIIDVPVGNHLLAEIAKIRALKLLIFGLAKELNKPLDTFPRLHAIIRPHIISNELETVIERCSLTMAAVFGGVDEICIDWQFDTDMSLTINDKRRLCRNIHWLIKQESQLSGHSDPLNGSYWIETCTRAFVNRAWTKIKTGGDS